MTILASEIRFTKSALTSDTTPAQNGGRYTETALVSGIKNALFPDITAAQRAAGAEHWRKVFVGVRNADNLALVDPKISLESATPGDSYLLLYPGTQTDTEDTMIGRPYGIGTLAADASATATEITVTTEADFSGLAASPFQVGDLLRVDARATAEDSGDTEYTTISSVSYSGATLTLGVAALANSYTAADGVHVASVIEPGDLAAGYSALSTTGGITYDDTGSPPSVPALGGIAQTWTITVTDAATGAISVTGDTLGSQGTGSTGVNLSPANPNGGVYFTLLADGWGGTPSDGDTLVFTTAPAAMGIWMHRVTPAGADALESDGGWILVEGESA